MPFLSLLNSLYYFGGELFETFNAGLDYWELSMKHPSMHISCCCSKVTPMTQFDTGEERVNTKHSRSTENTFLS